MKCCKSYLIFISLLLLSIKAQSEPVQINSFNVNNSIITSDSQYIVYNDIGSDSILRRFSVKIDGLTDPVLITDGDFENTFRVDPDDNRVYSFIDDTDPISLGFNTVLSSTIDGSSSSILFNGNADNLDSTNFIRFSNIFHEGTDFYLFTIENGGIYSIPADGSGQSRLLSTNLSSLDEVEAFRISRDRETVVYSALINDTFTRKLYSAPVDGSSAPILLGELPNSTDVDGTFIFSQDDSSVVFIAETFEDDGSETVQLNTVKVDGSSNIIPLSEPVTADRPDIDINLSNEDVVLFSVQDFFNDFSQLFSVQIDGSQPPILLDSGLNIDRILSVTDGQFAVYTIENPQEFNPPAPGGLVSTSRNENIFITKIDGSMEPQILFDFNNDSPDREIDRFFILTDDERFTFFISPSRFPTFSMPTTNPQLFRATNSGSFLTEKISIDSVVVTSFQLNDDQTNIFYTAESIESGLIELYQAELDGSNPIKISLPEHGDVLNFEISNDNNFIIYEAVDLSSELVKLYTAELNINPAPLCFPIKAKNGNFVTICL